MNENNELSTNQTTGLDEQTNIKSFFATNISSRLAGGVSLSDKTYKIIGLKCLAEELPESLYFMLAEGLVFKIPYLANERDIINYDLNKNIQLISKILSYFELEEAEKDSKQELSQVLMQPFLHENINLSNKEFKLNWMYSQVTLFERIFNKKSESLDSLGKISSFVKKTDIDRYYSWRNKNSITSLLSKIIDYSETKEIKVSGFPASIKKIFIELSKSFEDCVNTAYKNFIYIVPATQLKEPNSIVTNFLNKILTTSFDVEGVPLLKLFKDEIDETFNSTFDLINKQFDIGFKYTEENFNIFKNSFNFTNSQILNNFDTGHDIVDSYNLYEDKLFNEIISNSYKNFEMFDMSKMKKEDTRGLEYMLNSFVDTSYAIGAYARKQNNITCTVNMFKEIELTPEKIAARYKDMINLSWSEELTRTVKFSTKDIEESIRHRYFFISSSQERNSNFLDQRNLVIDTMLPEIMFKNNLDIEKINRNFQNSSNLFTKTTYAISPLTASVLGCKQIPIEHLCRILGYTKENIKSMMNIVKNRSFSFVFVGTGGTGNNTAIWLSKMLDMCNLPFLFERVYAFEKEAAELHNLLRFPKDPYTITIDTGIFSSMINDETKKNKCNIIAGELRSLSKNIPCCFERYIAESESAQNYPTLVFDRETTTEPVLDKDGNTIDFESVTKTLPARNAIFYGAPSINTRENLSKIGNFISATHASNNCNIYINPEQDSSIQVESYGMIQLTPFFMNQIRMAIGLLEILSADNVYELLKLKDHSFLEYKFDGESKLKNDRVYNFKIIENASMATENQTATMNLEF